MKYFRDEFFAIIKLSLPLIVASLAEISMQFIDIAMMGRLGQQALASGSLGLTVFIFLFIVSDGVIQAVGIKMTRAYALKNIAQVECTIQNGLWLTILLGIPSTFLIWVSPSFLKLIGQDYSVVARSESFFHILAFAFMPGLIFSLLSNFVVALKRPKIVALITLLAVPFNIIGSNVFMFGMYGLPTLGLTGVSLSTTLVTWLMTLGIFIYVKVHKVFREYKFIFLHKINFKNFFNLLYLGLPIGVFLGLEISLFFITTLLMGYFSTNTLAAHQVVMQAVTVVSVICIAISQAMTFRIATNLGEKCYLKAKFSIYAGLFLSVLISVFFCIFFLKFSMPIIGFFINKNNIDGNEVAQLALNFMHVSVFFLIIDSLHITLNGALRGYNDTLTLMRLGLLSYLIVGMIMEIYFGFILGWKGVGLWIGLISGLITSSIFFYKRLLVYI